MCRSTKGEFADVSEYMSSNFKLSLSLLYSATRYAIGLKYVSQSSSNGLSHESLDPPLYNECCVVCKS